MGNCIRHESSMWAGEDWGCLANGMNGDSYCDGDQANIKIMKRKKNQIEEASQRDSCCSTTTTTSNSSKIRAATEVKIKITKKQWEELLGKVEFKQTSVEQVLAQLIRVSDGYETQLQRSWRPALQSIPEVN
ncbi:uncharacterized protein [Pyrus communis]|uniref:uncharacterized protein n=1 Tax=Pyrus communis TaxID=23211 RepID=UPI0035C2511D